MSEELSQPTTQRAATKTLQSQMTSDDDVLFRCVLKNARILVCLLQTINMSKNIIVIFSEKGIQFTSELNKSFQMTAYLQRELFSSFIIPEKFICFKLSSKMLCDCLTSMLNCTNSGDSQENDKDNHHRSFNHQSNDDDICTSLEIIYNDIGHPLILVLKDDISITECTLQTQESENMIAFEIDSDKVVSRFIMQSDFFRDLLNELSLASESLQINSDPEFGLVFVTTNQNVTSIKKIPKNCPKLISQNFKELQTNSYMTKFVKMCMKALNQSTKICIKIDENGLLNIEFMITLFGDIKCFVQTYCLPNIESTL